jgi:hypothetical protein
LVWKRLQLLLLSLFVKRKEWFWFAKGCSCS